MPTDTTAVEEDRRVAVTKVRGVRVKDELWEPAQEVAAEQDEPLAAFIVRALHAYVVDPNATNAALAQIRGAVK